VENAKDNSSAYKGESLEDTIQTISNYADCIILRHPDDDSAQRAAKISSVPVINAGAGKNEHPTQALLDAFTIYERFGRLDNLKMTVVGDLMRGRTVYSLVYLLSKYKNNSFTFVSSPNSRINDELRNFLNENNVRFEEKDHLNGSVAESDILYATRIQRERCKTEEEYIEAKKGMIVNSEVLKILPKDAIIMHPLPRVDEITPEVDHDPRAYYFKQVQNGVYLRMGLLAKLFEK
jgi:aspartate carbamoyltransferase catalytic subunit